MRRSPVLASLMGSGPSLVAGFTLLLSCGCSAALLAVQSRSAFGWVQHTFEVGAALGAEGRQLVLYTGRSMSAEEGERWGYYNRLVAAGDLEADAMKIAQQIASGPTFAHGITKTQLNQEWNMGLDQAIESEAQAQAICMQTQDFERAYRAFVAKEKPVFEGN